MPGTGENIEIKGLDDVIWRIKSLPDAAKKQIIDDVANYAIDTAFVDYPQRVNHGPGGTPYVWQSPKQRRAFFASNGFGRGIPTKQTGELKSSWNFYTDEDSVKFINQANHAEFVVGKNIQRGHIADGWKNLMETWSKRLTFQSAKFRSVVMNAVQKAIRKVKLG